MDTSGDKGAPMCLKRDSSPLVIVEEDGLTVRKSKDGRCGCAIADRPFSREHPNCYFEVKIVAMGRAGSAAIGFASPQAALDCMPGWNADSYSYHCDDGARYHGSGRGTRFGPSCTSGDIIGAGIDTQRNEMYFTKNGVRLGTAFADVRKDCMCPVVAVAREHPAEKTDTTLQLNFAGPFLEACSPAGALKLQKKDVPVEECGVRLSWLRSWADAIVQKLGEDVRTDEVVRAVVVPDTSEHGCRYIDLLDQRDVGTPNFYVSHSWSWNFSVLVDYLSRRLQSSPDAFVWLDICAVNQHSHPDKGEHSVDVITSLPSVLQKVDATLLVLDEEGEALTRVWVLYEVWMTVKCGKKLEILAYEMPNLGSLFEDLDVRKAEASLESDRKRILAEIEAGIGCTQLSLCIKQALVNSAEQEAQQMLDSARESSDGPEARATQLDAAHSSDKAALVMQAAGQPSKSVDYASVACNIRLKVQGEENPHTLTSQANLATMLQDAGRLQESMDLQQHTLKMRQRVHGDEAHPRMLESMQNLAQDLFSMGKLGEAEDLQLKTLDLCMKKLGPDDRLTMVVEACLCDTLDEQGRYDEGEVLRRRVLKKMMSNLGPEHPRTLFNIACLGINQMNQGNFDESERIKRMVLELRKKVLGPEHIDTISSMAILSVTLAMKSRLVISDALDKEAKDLQHQVLQLRRKVQGEEHPATLGSAMDVAVMLKESGKLHEAEELQRHTLDILRRVNGPEHPQTLTAMGSWAFSLKALGKLDEAEAIIRDVLALQLKELPPGHPVVLNNTYILVDILDDKGKDEALELQRQMLLHQVEASGIEHPLFLTYNSDFSRRLAKRGKAAAEAAKSKQGSTDPREAAEADALKADSKVKLEEAAALQRLVLQVKMRVEGPSHPSTLSSMFNYSEALKDIGKVEEAEGLMLQAVMGMLTLRRGGGPSGDDDDEDEEEEDSKEEDGGEDKEEGGADEE